MNKNFWLPRDVGFPADEDTDISSRTEAKRSHQWFVNASEQELFCNKKQAIEVSKGRPVLGISNTNASLWKSTSGCQSLAVQFTDHLFGPDPVRTLNIPCRNSSSVETAERSFVNQFENNSLFSLTMSRAMEDPSDLDRRVKVSQVGDSDNATTLSMGYSYCRGDGSTISMGTTHGRSSNNLSLGPTHSNGFAPTFSKMDENFILMGQTFNKGDGSCMLMDHCYNKVNDSISFIDQPFEKGDCSFVVDQQCGKEDSIVMSMSPNNSQRQGNFISIGPTYNRTCQSFFSTDCTYQKGDGNISVGLTPDKADTNSISIGAIYDGEDPSIISMGKKLDKGERTTISFGGLQDEPPEANNLCASTMSSYDYLISQSFVLSEEPGQKNMLESNADPLVTVAPAHTSKTDTVFKSKEQKAPKKISPNSFPSNVKSLLSTGIFDGVLVKYVSWSREKNLRGIIKGTSYLCGCNDCQHSKALNAYEFERHAGCKTKHPNNHIYFENGKTIYSVVQELKSTPQETLFDAIQNITGSSTHQKNFRIWKASYQAATRELHRIYGKDEVVVPA